MSTDSTELTFVRCPACRSLVPAISTRCRMCGAGLDANSGGDAGQAEQHEGRVRQRTMSQPQSELNIAVNKVRAEAGVNERLVQSSDTEVSPVVSQMPASQPIVEDPLGAYIEEVEGEEQEYSAKPVVEKTTAARPVPITEKYSEESGSSIVKSIPINLTQELGTSNNIVSEATISAPHILIPKVEAKAVNSKLADTDLSRSSSENSKNVDKEISKEKQDTGPRVIVESGLRKPGKSNLSFGRPKGQTQEPNTASQSGNTVEVAKSNHQSRQSGSHQKVEVSKVDLDNVASPNVVVAKEGGAMKDKITSAEQHKHQVSKTAVVQQSSVRKAEAQTGRLFGWLVSYSNPDGQAIELREGKFFVTSSSLKVSDLIIEDASISTPHALVNISAEAGFQVQDLMSDRGVFIRKRAADTYQREPETFDVEHGDWLRFGDVEFLVSLIAHVGVR